MKKGDDDGRSQQSQRGQPFQLPYPLQFTKVKRIEVGEVGKDECAAEVKPGGNRQPSPTSFALGRGQEGNEG